MGKVVTPIEKLTRTVERGFAAVDQRMERGFAAVAEDMTKLATKEDVMRIETRLFSIEQELKDIKRRLAKLEDSLEAMQVYGDDIKELRERVKAIERQLTARR